MHTKTYIELGVIQRKQGLKGSIVAWLHQEVPQPTTLKTLFIQVDHTLVPYGIESFILKDHKAIIKLQGIENPRVAHELKGRLIFIPQESSSRLSSQKVQLARLVGYYVTDIKKGNLGPVKSIHDFPQQHLLAVNYQDKELLIPYHRDIVIDVAHKQKSIMVKLPQGFIEASF